MPARKKILIAEDYEESRKIMALYLTRLGYDVAEAVDGEEALTQAATQHPDLIIMDISMPRMDGIEATALLKHDPETQHIPILVATAHVRNSLAENAIKAGACDVIVKPLNLVQFRKLVDRYLQPEQTFTPCTADHAAVEL